MSCPSCGHFLMRATFSGKAEANCSQARCKAAVLVSSDGTKVVVELVEKPVLGKRV